MNFNRIQCAMSRPFPTAFKQFVEWYSKLIPGPMFMHAPIPLTDAREVYDLAE